MSSEPSPAPSAPPKTLPHKLLLTELTGDQRKLLTIISGPQLLRGTAAEWGYVLDHCEMQDIDAERTLRSLPRVGHASGLTYGFTSAPQRPFMSEGDEIRLTIAASLVLPEFRMAIGESFLRVVRHMVQLHLNRPRPVDGKSVPAVLRSDELAQAMPHMRPEYIDVLLPDIFEFEPYFRRGNNNGGTWHTEIQRDILKFKEVATLEEYVAKVCELIEEAGKIYPKASPTAVFGSPFPYPAMPDWSVPAPTAAPAEEPIADPDGAYVDEGLLRDLEDAGARTKWKLDKLLRLADELNSNFAVGNFYTSLALVRAICDHVPPAFGKKNWVDFHSSYIWTRKQDKGYADQLNWFRDPANDVLHRPMGETESRIAQRDVPPAHALNGVLQELLVVLKATAPAGS